MSSLSRADHAMTTGREGEIHCLLEPNSRREGGTSRLQAATTAPPLRAPDSESDFSERISAVSPRHHKGRIARFDEPGKPFEIETVTLPEVGPARS